MKKQKQFAVAMVAIMLLSVLILTVPIVMSEDENATLGDENVTNITNVTGTNETVIEGTVDKEPMSGSGDEQAEGTFADASPLSNIPENTVAADADVVIMDNGADDAETLCEDVDIIFIMDCSGSMLRLDCFTHYGLETTRLAAAKTAAKGFIDLLPTDANTRVGVVSYESYGRAEIEQSLTTDFDAAKDAIDLLSIRSREVMTSVGEGFEKGREELHTHGNANKRIFLLLTDGLANSYPSGWTVPAGWISPPGTWETAESYAFVEAHDAMTLDAVNPTKIYTVGMGKQSDIDEDFLEVLAHSSGGEYFFAGTTAVSRMFNEVRADICLGDITVLILCNLPRMADLYDFSLIDSSPIAAELDNALDNLRDNNPNGRGVIIDLGYLDDASIDTAYDNWDGHEGDVTLTNNLVDAIDDYIEDLKQDEYPLLRYVIFVGSHEIIPMEARPQDYVISATERNWAGNLPQTFGYLYDLYHAGTNGHYLTDTPYSDLSYMDTSADHELTPELSVARLVETPQQVIDVIDAYMDNNGEIPKNHFVSMSSSDYLDGGTQASDYMDATGVPTDDSLVDCAYDSTDVPPLLNAQHDITYFAGHGDYNVISTGGGDAFMAGNHATRGDTDGINPIDGAVIITSGCHNGVNFGNILYHAPDAGTTYHEFPEDFAERGIVAYIGATGYTVISVVHDGAGNHLPCNADASFTGYNERLATNVVYYVVNGVDIGRAFRNGAKDYYRAHYPIDDCTRRVLAIPTLYGIPTYKDPVTPAQLPTVTKASTIIQKLSYETTPIPTKPVTISEKVTISVSDYTVEPSGIVTIPGVEQVVSFNDPILPELFVEKTFPRGSRLLSIEWDEEASESVVVINNVPIAGIADSKGSIEGKFYYDGFWPVRPYKGYNFLTFGAGGSEVGFGIYPVQYNSETGETRIWTKMVFDVRYEVPDTGILVVSLSTDKKQYPSNENVKLSMELSNSRYTRLVDLDIIMRDLDTSDELITTGIGLMGLEGGTTTEGSYLVNLGDIPTYQIEGKTIEAELIVSDPHNGDILASKSVVFEVGHEALPPIETCRRIFFSTEEEFITRGPEPPDGNPIISDGDLLGLGCVVFARNRELLAAFEAECDLGLDAADVIDVERRLVAFSTELGDPQAKVWSGDLLATNGAVIPNIALLAKFDIPRANLGLDAVHFIGDKEKIIAFLGDVAKYGRDFWMENPSALPEMLEEYDIDIWFSTEGTAPKPEAPLFIDGDLLSARMGTVVVAHADLLPSSVPAGIPDRGVDFGLDAATADRRGNRELIHFSTEILYEGRPSFTDGDVLLIGNGLVCTNEDLVRCFEPNANELGLDALSIAVWVELKPQITHFNQVSVSEISASGLAYDIEQPFGQWIQIHGYIPDDVDEFRVVYCNASDWPCTESEIDGIEVVSAQNWHVDADDGMGGCTGDRHWYSDADGWFNAPNYRALRDCTSDLPLTMWNSLTAPDPDGLYIVWLQYRRDGIEYGESYNHYIQLDNTRPKDLAVAPKEGAICGEFTPDDMPMMVQGHFHDTHFWWYKLVLYGGDPLGIEDYGRINHYDSLTDNVGPEGTTGPGMVDLHKVDINDLPAKSIDDCAYAVRLWTWDRTIRGNRFDAPNDDRPIWFDGWHSWTAFTFDYTP